MESVLLSVKQLNFYVKSLLEGDVRLANVTVSGEISNFKNHYSSGHLYFTLKDSDAAIRTVMFKGNAARLKVKPCDGMKVAVKGRVSVYEKDGQYQLYAEEMTELGVGEISDAFLKVKEKLEAEGLFDKSTKRPLPRFPKKLAVITSDTGAAVRDIFNILSRRWPLAEVVMCPVTVQGQQAADDMIAVLDKVYTLPEIEAAVIGRGGGSIEDLWCFNSEALARKIYESPFPIISAVGHETDFTICDFVADLRAPTPSAAAELIVPDISEINSLVDKYTDSVKNAAVSSLKYCSARYESYINRPVFNKPTDTVIGNYGIILDNLSERLLSAVKIGISKYNSEFLSLVSKLDSLSPLKVLSRGYSVATRDGKTVTSVKDVFAGDTIDVRFSDGTASCTANSVRSESYE